MKEEISGSGNGDLLKSLVSISDAINEQIFNANQTIDGSFINRQAIIADTGPIETLKLQLEEREQEEQDKDVVRTADEVLTQLREEQERERIRAMQDDYSQTFTNDELDQMEWVGDRNAIWTIGGRQISRTQLFNATKNARNKWENSEEAQKMSPDEREKVKHIWSQLGQISIRDANGEARYNELVKQLPPKAQAQLDEQKEQQLDSNVRKDIQEDARRNLDINDSTSQRDNVISYNGNNNTQTQNLTTNEVDVSGGISTNVNARLDFNCASQNTAVIQPSNSNNLVIQPTVPKVQLASLDGF